LTYFTLIIYMKFMFV